MSRYQAFDPESEMTGQTVLGMVKSIMHDDIADILARHNLSDIDPNSWYRLQDLLDVLNDIAGHGVNSSTIFISIGMGAANLGYEAMPLDRRNIPLEQFLAAYATRYQTLHHGEVGYVKYDKVDDKHFVMTLKTPFPDDVLYGVFYGYARLLRPKGKGIALEYDEQQPRRDAGGEQTVIHVRLLD